jgi:murein DD-endopeptidase MepM/ murein hydrolase activator NlpD
MSSVIQHQKVARRRYRPVNTLFSSTSNTHGAVRFNHTGSGRSGGLLRTPAAVRREQRVGGDVVPGLIGMSSSTGTATVLPFPSFSTHRLFDFDPQDIPLYVAAVLFALVVNVLLLAVGVDRIVLSNAASRVVLPPQQELVTRSLVSPGLTAFPGLDEAMSVDPTRFSRLEVEDYVVQPGDTLSDIALRTGLRMDTLISFNRINDVRRLQAGATYQIPNRDGVLHTVRSGESIVAIASRHGVAVNTILDVNDLPNESVTEGQVLFIPGGQMNNTELRIVLGELFAWPTQGRFSSGFGMRPDPFTGQRRFHNGIDIANRPGTPIRAAASGRVVHVEEQIANYGRFVIIRHADGFQTLYAHMNSFNVRLGQSVSRGQQIGTMGSTGRSTGPHLHFSVIHNGTFVNPMRYLH